MDRKTSPARRRSQRKRLQRTRKNKYSSTDSEASFIETDPSSISSIASSDTDYDEFQCNKKSIAKRIRKRRRSCTRTNYYESEVTDTSKDDIFAYLGKYLNANVFLSYLYNYSILVL